MPTNQLSGPKITWQKNKYSKQCNYVIGYENNVSDVSRKCVLTYFIDILTFL